MDINTLVQQMPNFAGFLFALAFMYKSNQALIAQNSTLMDAIISRKNCDESASNTSITDASGR